MLQYSYYFLERLARFLNNYLEGTIFQGCQTSEGKDLNLVFLKEKDVFVWKVTFQKSFFLFSFPVHNGQFFKPQKMGAENIGSKLNQINTIEQERVIKIQFEQGSVLLKCFQQGGVYFMDETQQCTSKFPYQITDLPNPKNRTQFDFSKESWLANPDVKKFWPTLSKIEWGFLDRKGFNENDVENQWHILSELKADLEQSRFFYAIQQSATKLAGILPEGGEVLMKTFSPIELCSELFKKIVIEEGFESEKTQLIEQKQAIISKHEKGIQKAGERLHDLRHNVNYRMIGDLLMAHLHELQKGMGTFTASDFSTGEPVSIKLNPKLQPHENAQYYYRKAKNLWQEIENLENTIEQKKSQIALLLEEIEELSKLERWKEIKKEKKKQEIVEEPFFRHQCDGWEIWVGKNAKKNDELTQKFAHKEDLWLHAKHTSGSHVIVKQQSGKKIPNHVVERAAELAAYFSKSKNDTLAAVIVTPKKFVRKPKGSAPGSVVVDKEEVVLVAPRP